MDCLQIAESLLDIDQFAIIPDYFLDLHFFFRHVCEDDITAVKLLFFSDLRFIEGPGEGSIGDGRLHELTDFELVDDLAYPDS